MAKGNVKSIIKRKTNKTAVKLPTGIKGFDEVLAGGFQSGRTLLINGSTGTGKTVLLNEFLYRGITKFNEPGVFVTFEEKPDYIIKNVEKFGWNYKKLIKEKKLVFVNVGIDAEAMDLEIDDEVDLTPILNRIKYAVKQIGAKRISIDSMGSLYDRFSNKRQIRNIMLKVVWFINSLGCRTMMTSETRGEGIQFSRFGVEDFVADGVVGLSLDLGDQEYKRRIYVRKIRGESYRSGMVEFDITCNGIEIFPKIPISSNVRRTEFNKRRKFGIEKLDKFLDGGVPEGHMMMTSGNTGTGKSILGLHFMMEGLRNDEGVVMVALEEPVPQVIKNAKQLGWDLLSYEKKGKFKFVTSPLIDIRPDKLLYKIIDACTEVNATRVVIDSISTMHTATFNPDKVRQFLIQIASYFKGNGITCVFNYLSGSNFGAVKGQLLSLTETNNLKMSSVMDGVILLLYVERQQAVSKLLTILKLRGSNHNKSIFTFYIDKNGFEIGEQFTE